MEARNFLADFGHIANARGGIAQLRKLVLHLAVSGCLTSQFDDEDASDFFSEITFQRERLEKEGAIRINRKIRSETSVGGWHIPANWRWCRFGELCSFSSGRTPARKESKYWNTGEYPWFSIADLVHGKVVNDSSESVSDAARKEVFKSKPAPAGSLLMSFKLTIGKLCLLGVDAYHNEAIIRIEPFSEVLKNYFFKCLNGFDLFADNKAAIKGKTLNQHSISNILIALPPKNEIPRIVHKVDELMALCDMLEKQQQTRRKVKNNLRQSTLEAVASSNSPHELQSNWARLAENIERLFDVPEDVVTLKGLVLDLAVSGKLLSIDDRDVTTGCELLETIEEKRIEWSRIAVGQEKREAQAILKKLRTQQIDTPEITLPKNWAWASVLQVAKAVVDCHNKTAPYVSKGIHLIRTSDIRNGQMDLASSRKISEETYAYWARRMPPKSGDIFFTREAPMGEAAIVPDGEKVCLGQRVLLIRVFPELFNNRFLLYVIQSPSFQARMADASIGMGVKHLRVGGVEGLAVPVPPKFEQDRIVAIVDDIFRQCDRYADQLSRKQLIASNLAASAVSSLSGIAIENIEDKPVKAPETELLAPLRLGTTPSVKAQAPLATILARQKGEMTAKDLWQRFGGEIDGFYAQLKTEVAHGWVLEPAPAEMREKQNDTVSA